ncbi:hypothetical protein BT69DRAFT_1298583 [Atractiella rhizophila]|nr:hypothetical protein BT69DRAFT_1298583 [Atractiella rhizophila]
MYHQSPDSSPPNSPVSSPPSSHTTLAPLLSHLSLTDRPSAKAFSFSCANGGRVVRLSPYQQQSKRTLRVFRFPTPGSDEDSDQDEDDHAVEIEEEDEEEIIWAESIEGMGMGIDASYSLCHHDAIEDGDEIVSRVLSESETQYTSDPQTPTPPPSPTNMSASDAVVIQPTTTDALPAQNVLTSSPPNVCSSLAGVKPLPSLLHLQQSPISPRTHSTKRKLSSASNTSQSGKAFKSLSLFPNAPVERTKKRKMTHRHYRSPVLVLRPLELGVIPIAPSVKVPEANFTFATDCLPLSNNPASISRQPLLPALIPKIQTIHPPSWWASLALPPDTSRPSRFQPPEHRWVGTGEGWKLSIKDMLEQATSEDVRPDPDRRKRAPRHAMSLPSISPVSSPILPPRIRAMSCPSPGTGYCQPFYLYKETQPPPQKAHLLAMLRMRMAPDLMAGSAGLRFKKWALWNAFAKRPPPSIMDFNGEAAAGLESPRELLDDDDLYSDSDSGDELDDYDDEDEVLDITMEAASAQPSQKEMLMAFPSQLPQLRPQFNRTVSGLMEPIDNNDASLTSSEQSSPIPIPKTPVMSHAKLPGIALPSLPPTSLPLEKSIR